MRPARRHAAHRTTHRPSSDLAISTSWLLGYIRLQMLHLGIDGSTGRPLAAAFKKSGPYQPSFPIRPTKAQGHSLRVRSFPPEASATTIS